MIKKIWCAVCHQPAQINYNGRILCALHFNKEQQKMSKKNSPDEGSNVLMLQAQIAELEREINMSWKLLWLLANRKGGKLTFTPKELQTMKDGGQISRTIDPEGVVALEAL